MARTDDQETRRSGARRWLDNQQDGFERSCFIVPEGMPLFKLKEGMMRISIYPFRAGKGNPNAEEGELYFERTYFAHRRIGAKGRSYVCLAENSGYQVVDGKKKFHDHKKNEACPVCKFQGRLRRDEDADDKLIKSMNTSKRQVFLVFDHKDPDKGLQLWDISYHLFGIELKSALLSAADEDGDESVYDFYKVKSGKMLKLLVETESFDKREFQRVKRVDFKDRLEPLPKFSDVPCLDDLIKIPTYDELDNALHQRAGGADEDEGKSKKPADDDDDDDWDDEPAGKKNRKPADDDDDDDDEADKKAKKRKPADDDDDDDDEDMPKGWGKKNRKPADDDDDDEDEPAASRKKPADDDDDDEDEPAASRKKPADDDDDDDWDDEPAGKKNRKPADDDDDDEKPKSRRRRRASDDD